MWTIDRGSASSVCEDRKSMAMERLFVEMERVFRGISRREIKVGRRVLERNSWSVPGGYYERLA